MAIAQASIGPVSRAREEAQALVGGISGLADRMAHGDTHQAALANLMEARWLWSDSAIEYGDPAPEPKGWRLTYAELVGVGRGDSGRVDGVAAGLRRPRSKDAAAHPSLSRDAAYREFEPGFFPSACSRYSRLPHQLTADSVMPMPGERCLIIREEGNPP